VQGDLQTVFFAHARNMARVTIILGPFRLCQQLRLPANLSIHGPSKELPRAQQRQQEEIPELDSTLDRIVSAWQAFEDSAIRYSVALSRLFERRLDRPPEFALDLELPVRAAMVETESRLQLISCSSVWHSFRFIKHVEVCRHNIE
jgi:hypothetical protein